MHQIASQRIYEEALNGFVPFSCCGIARCYHLGVTVTVLSRENLMPLFIYIFMYNSCSNREWSY